MKFVILDTLSITEKVKAGQEPVIFNNNQSILRVNVKNEDLLFNYKKYTAEEILSLNKSLNAQSLLLQSSVTEVLPFSSKTLINGQKLFSRMMGIKYNIIQTEQALDFVIPFANVKMTGVELIGAINGDSASLQILDTANGTVSGFPNAVLNTFGQDVFIAKDYYLRENVYGADLFIGLVIRTIYKTDVIDRNVYINYILHEVK